jgi:predicted Rossmann-fold nucleotide-binding protein
MFQKAIDTHFMRPEHGAIWQVAQTPEEAIDMLYNIPHWNKDIQKIASI